MPFTIPAVQEEWEVEFARYKATPEYLAANQGMTVDEFKFIYFWEWGHRMWGRALGEPVRQRRQRIKGDPVLT
jgi:heme A synthase